MICEWTKKAYTYYLFLKNQLREIEKNGILIKNTKDTEVSLWNY